MHLTRRVSRIFNPEILRKRATAELNFQKKIFGPAGTQVFIFCHQNKYSGRQKLYLRINGFSFVKDNGLSLVYVFPKKKVTYLGGQVGDQARKFGRDWVKAGSIGDPMGRNVEPSTGYMCLYRRILFSVIILYFTMLELLWLIVDNSCEKAGTFVEGAENLKLFFAKSPVDVALAVETN